MGLGARTRGRWGVGQLSKWRTRGAWLLVVPFLWFSEPDFNSLIVGTCLALVGVALRAWAASTIDKDATLAVSGPYRYIRHPLYVASFLIGIGIAQAGGHWFWPTVFVALYLPVYGFTILREERALAKLFGDEYKHYRETVPAVLPRLWPTRDMPATRDGGEPEVLEDGCGSATGVPDRKVRCYLENREWEAAVGAGAMVTVLAVKLALSAT